MIWFALLLWHINHCRLSNVKSHLDIYIKYMFWSGWVDGISTIVSYLTPNSLIHIYQIYMIWFGWLLDIYIKYMFWFGWVDGISTIVGYLTPNSLYTYISNIYDLVWLAFMTYQPL